jgi:hypothetical protein
MDLRKRLAESRLAVLAMLPVAWHINAPVQLRRANDVRLPVEVDVAWSRQIVVHQDFIPRSLDIGAQLGIVSWLLH